MGERPDPKARPAEVAARLEDLGYI